MTLINTHAYFHTDDAEYCERCGSPIANVFVAVDDNKELHYFGSECINIVTSSGVTTVDEFDVKLALYLAGKISLEELEKVAIPQPKSPLAKLLPGDKFSMNLIKGCGLAAVELYKSKH